MVMPSGRYLHCRGCGRLFPEGDCRGEYTCGSQKCRDKVKEDRAAQEALVQKEVEAAKMRRAYMYHI